MQSQFDIVKFSVTCKIWRNMNGLTLRDMCELCSIASSTMSFIENGERAPNMAEFSHLCEQMGFDASTFFKKPEKRQNG